MAGIHKDSGYEWMKTGSRRVWEVNGQERTPTDYEARCAVFSDALTRAWALSEARDIEGVLRAGTEPAVETSVTVVKERNAKGRMVVVKETTTTRTLPPDPTNLRWHAQHRFNPRWSDRHKVEISNSDQAIAPTADTINNIIAAVEELRAIDRGDLDPGDTLPSRGIIEPRSNGYR